MKTEQDTTSSPHAPEVAGLIAELRAGLEGVTPGPWQKMRTPGADDEEMYVVMAQPSPALRGFTMPIAWAGEPLVSHILRCSPENIAKLLDLIETLSAQVAGAVRVKALEWDDATSVLVGPHVYFSRSTTPFSSYRTEQRILGKWWMTGPDGEALRDEAGAIASFDTLDAAKAGAQVDYETRILAALESTPPQPDREGQEAKAELVHGENGLLPCPFCGCSATMTEMEDQDERRFFARSISCDGCDATVEDAISFGYFVKMSPGQAENELAERVSQIWNCRAPTRSATPPDQSAEIERLTRERDEWKSRYEEQWAQNVTVDMASGALASIQTLLDSGGIPRGTFADDQVRNLVALYNRAEAALAEMREALKPFAEWEPFGVHISAFDRGDDHLVDEFATHRKPPSVGDLRRARKALAAQNGDRDGDRTQAHHARPSACVDRREAPPSRPSGGRTVATCAA